MKTKYTCYSENLMPECICVFIYAYIYVRIDLCVHIKQIINNIILIITSNPSIFLH